MSAGDGAEVLLTLLCVAETSIKTIANLLLFKYVGYRYDPKKNKTTKPQTSEKKQNLTHQNYFLFVISKFLGLERLGKHSLLCPAEGRRGNKNLQLG